MTALADDFDEVRLPVDITVENNETLLLLINSQEPQVLMPAISGLREQIKDESTVTRCLPRLVELANTYSNEQVHIVIAWYMAALANAATTEKWAFDLLSKTGSTQHLVAFARQLDNNSLSERCFEALVNLAVDPITSKEIIQYGALEVFKEALKRDDSTIQSQVSLALFRMSSDFENRRFILESGLFDSIIDFLATEDLDEEVLGNALQATSLILEDPGCVAHFEERTGWNSIIPYIEDADKQIQTYAYIIIARISSNESFHYHFDEELLNKLINALTDLEEFDPVLPYLLQVLRNCTKITMVARALSQQVPLLLDRIYSSQTDYSQKEVLADILSRLSMDHNTHSSILESEQLSRICKLIKHEIILSDNTKTELTRPVQMSALQIVDSVCENRSIRNKLHEFGAIEQLVAFLHQAVTGEDPPPEQIPPPEKPHEPVKEKMTKEERLAAERAAAERAAAEAEAARLAELNKKPVIHTGVEKGWRIEAQMLALPMIYKMIGDPKLQALLIQKSIGDLEILICSEYPDIVNTSLLIVATLAVDDACRADVAGRPKFMQQLIALISSRKVAIRRNTLHALNSLSMKPEIAEQLCGFGLIEKLRKFASSSQMINLNLSTFAATALETLCTHNTVAKFWVKDVLDFADVLHDGFYSIDPRAEIYQSIDSLLADVIHLRTEALLLDKNRDSGLQETIVALQDSFSVRADQSETSQKKKQLKKNDAAEPPVQFVVPEWPQIASSVAQFVIQRMGGAFEGGRIPYEAEVSRCKYKTHSDVVMLGQLQVGAVRHRALMYKYLAHLYGMEVHIKRNREDLTCDVQVKKNGDVYGVDLSGDGEILRPIHIVTPIRVPTPEGVEA